MYNAGVEKFWIIPNVSVFVLHKHAQQINGLIHGPASVSAMKKNAVTLKYLIKTAVLASVPVLSVNQGNI